MGKHNFTLSEMKLNRVAEEIKRKYQTSPSTQSEDVPPLVLTETAEHEHMVGIIGALTERGCPVVGHLKMS